MIEINKNSWHYKLIHWRYKGEVPNNLCEYIEKIIFNIILCLIGITAISFYIYSLCIFTYYFIVDISYINSNGIMWYHGLAFAIGSVVYAGMILVSIIISISYLLAKYYKRKIGKTIRKKKHKRK